MFSIQEIAQISGGTLISRHPLKTISGFSIDSREVQAGDLFVALKGLRQDGHRFVHAALEKGAACALVEEVAGTTGNVIVVRNVLQALQRVARYYRAFLSIPVVGVTGSVGKTTTKECIGVLLSDALQVRSGYRNWNNHLGIPLNLLRVSDSDQCLVLELGANHPGEIKTLAELACPTVGVITGIHPAHLEGFESIDGIYRAKLELADYIGASGGTIVAYGDDAELMRRLRKQSCSVITFGTQKHCDVRISEEAAHEDRLYFRVNDKIDFRLRGFGLFNIMNAAAALATAYYFNLDLESLSQTWCALPLMDGRFRCERWESFDLTVVDDSYNASPFAFEQAVSAFEDLARGQRKIVIVGDMLELGPEAVEYHEKLGQYLAEASVDLVIGVGTLSQSVVDSFRTHRAGGEAACFQSTEAASEFVRSKLSQRDAILIKGSRANKLEDLKYLLAESLKFTPSQV